MIINYSCPNCGADMAYDIQRGKLYCSHCDYSEDIKTDEGGAEETANDQEKDTSEKVYHCVNCGGELKTDAKNCSLVCEYCGAPLVLEDRLRGEKRPQFIIPFKISRENAASTFRKWCHNGRFSPKGFMSAQNIQSLKPVYVPYWLYDAEVDAEVTARATRVNVYMRGDREYTETSFFDVHRRLKLSYKDVPYDASEAMEDTMMAKLEPYQFGEMKPFNMPYLAGFVADQYDYDSMALKPQLEEKINSYVNDYARNSISGYSTVNITASQLHYDKLDSHYAYLPLWFVSYRYRENEYIFAMNGQTGKVIGKPPVSRGKVFGWFAGISAVIFAVLMVIGGLL